MTRVSPAVRESVIQAIECLRFAKLSRNPIFRREAIAFAWSAYREHFLLFTTGMATLLLAWVALEIVVVTGQRFGIVLWALAHLAFLVFFAGLEVGLLRVSLELIDGRQPTISTLFARLSWGPRLLVCQTLYLLLVLAGLALFLIPGLYLGVRYALVGFVIADAEAQPIASFRRSSDLTDGTRGRLLVAFIGIVAFNCVGASLLGIGLLVTVPLSLLLTAGLHRELRNKPGVTQSRWHCVG